MIIREATAEDCLAFWGKAPVRGFKGVVAARDAEVLGIGGVYKDSGMLFAWTELSPSMTKKERALGARAMMDFLDDKVRVPVFAYAQEDYTTSAYLLVKLGFRPTGLFSCWGELFRREPN